MPSHRRAMNVLTKDCFHRSPECISGACSHQAEERLKAWRARPFPPARLGWVPLEVFSQEVFRKETAASNKEAQRLSIVRDVIREIRKLLSLCEYADWLAGYLEDTKGLPHRLLIPQPCQGATGFSGSPDWDGTGSWGRHVRAWEDRGDDWGRE